MKKTIIGLPRAFHYYRYGILWKNFFEKIGCKVILSSKTNQEIIKLGINNTPNECCLSYKIYVGHALSLIDKCDYLLLPKICNYQCCSNQQLMYENLKLKISSNEILTYNIKQNNYFYQAIGLTKIAIKFTKNPIKIIYSYIIGMKKQHNYNISKQNENKNKLTKEGKKVLLISPYYNLREEYINDIVATLEKNNIVPIFSSYIDSKIAATFSLYYKYIIPWQDYQEILGATAYYKYQIDGIIIIKSSQCIITSLLSEQIKKENNNRSIVNLTITGNDLNISPNLISFIDAIKHQKKDF